MAYTKKYIFGNSLTAGFKHPAGLVLMTLTLNINQEGTDAEYLASDYGMHFEKIGDTLLEANLDEFFLAPKEYNFTILDHSKTLYTLLFDSVDSKYISKDLGVKLEIKYTGDEAYVTEFDGNVKPTPDNWNEANNLFQFNAFTATNKLISTSLFDKKGDFSNPLGLTYTENPYIDPPSISTPRVWAWIKIKDLITKIFQLIDESITVEFFTNWIYTGYPTTSYIFVKAFDNPNWNFALTFDDLYATWIGVIFDSDKFEIENAGALLQQIAFEHGAVAGVGENGKAFFKQLFYYDASNKQDVGELLSHQKGHNYNDVDWVNLQNSLWDQDLRDSSNHRYVEKIHNISGSDRLVKSWGWAPVEIIENGYVDKRAGDNGLEKTIINYGDIFDYEGADPLADSNLRALESGESYYKIFGIRQPEITLDNPDAIVDGSGNKFNSINMFLSHYWHLLKGRTGELDYDQFRFKGLKYDFVKSFDYGSSGFSILSIHKDFDENHTDITALEVSQRTYTSQTDIPTQTIPNETVDISTRYSFAMDTIFTYEQIGGSAVYVGTIEPDEVLKEITVSVETVFLPDEIGAFRIYAGAVDLLTSDELLFTEINIKPKRLMKRFENSTKIYMEFLEGSNPATQGAGYITIEKLRKEA